ncbi:hypothetical protein MEO94_32300 [Dolichospermum sp. ST_sed9]|jgi:hypothetical protein|nr:hypothetical protein [Dolichospermum sp. ST_sed9]
MVQDIAGHSLDTATSLINLVSVDDTLSEATETATLNLATGTGYNLGTDKTATVNIFDPVLGSGRAIAKRDLGIAS